MSDVNSVNNAQNTFSTYETLSGETFRLTLNFALLYKVKANHPEAYKRYNAIMMAGVKDIFDQVAIMYVAYLCANTEVEVLPYEDFMEKLGDDTTGVAATVTSLLGRKKKAASATHS